MTIEQPPKRAKILTRLRINEVSLVDRGAGEQCRILISKRADDPADDNHPVEMPDHERRYWAALGATALRHAEERYAKEHGTGAADHESEPEPDVAPTPADDPSRFLFSKDTFLRKTYAAAVRGDEADRHDEEVPAGALVDGTPQPPDGASGAVPAKHRPISFDTVDGTRMKFPDERSLAEWLAIQQRIRKSSHSQDTTAMSTLDLSAIVKSYGITALAKHISSEGKSFGISEEELTRLATEDAQRRFPSDRADVAFAKLYSSDEGLALRQAIEIAKSAPLQDDGAAEAEADAAAAMKELGRIGDERWPSLTKAQRFARAFETNPNLAKRAHRRPSIFSSFPHPVTKMPTQTVTASLEPRVSTETDPDDPAEALAQLRSIGAAKWPSASQAQQFLNAVTDAENATLVRRALGPTAGSSPPRR